MYQTNLAFKNENEILTTEDWNYFVSEISKVFRFTQKETEWFSNCKTAQLIATIPFAAECIEPERTAIAHLCLYIAEVKGFQKYCAHVPADDNDIYNRLAFISTFEGGNKTIIKSGMSLLALIMLEGYYNTMEEDEKKHIYNPLVNKQWNYSALKKDLIKSIMQSENIFYNYIQENIDVWD